MTIDNTVDQSQFVMWKGRDGRFTPVELIKDYEKLKEQTLRPLFERWLALHTEMADLKSTLLDEVETLLSVCADQYQVKLGGDKGNVTLYRYDGEFSLSRKFQARVRFDERILAAETLVRQCLDTWSGEAGPELRKLVMAAFERNKEGEIRRTELVRLRALDIDDTRWKEAMAIIAEAEEIIDSACYFTVNRRDPKTGKYHSLLLDFSGIQPKRKTPQKTED